MKDGQTEKDREDVDSNQGLGFLVQWVPKEPETTCSVVKDSSTVVTTTNSSLTPTVSKYL